MREAPLYPSPFDPILKQLIWGDRGLETILKKPLGRGSPLRGKLGDQRPPRRRQPGGRRPLAGRSLRDLVRHRGAELLGRHVGHVPQFPCWSSTSTPTRSSRCRCIRMTQKGRSWPMTTARPRPGIIIHAEPGSLDLCRPEPRVTRRRVREGPGVGPGRTAPPPVRGEAG